MDADALDTLAVNVVRRTRHALVVKHPAQDLRAAALELGVDVVAPDLSPSRLVPAHSVRPRHCLGELQGRKLVHPLTHGRFRLLRMNYIIVILMGTLECTLRSSQDALFCEF